MPDVKPLPPPSARLLFFPSWDTEYIHFEHAADFPFTCDPGFSPIRAWWLADAALLAYWPPEQVPGTFARAGFPHTEFFTNGSTQCYVASNHDAAIVTFRGTEITQLEDSLADGGIKLVRWDGDGRVHQGFLGALDDVWDGLRAHLQTLGGRTVWFTGHSLGAALATLAARRWTRTDRPASGIYTIGSPRVGDRVFADEFDATFVEACFRYANGTDDVTDLPPELLGYAHVGGERRLAGRSEGHALLEGLAAGLLDHTPRRYATLIWNQLTGSGAASKP